MPLRFSGVVAIDPNMQTPRVEVKQRYSFIFERDLTTVLIDDIEIAASVEQLEHIAKTILAKLAQIKDIGSVGK